MKSPFALLLGASLAGETNAASLSPISRVVELLNGLSETAEKDGKKEEDLYEGYVCWAKTVINTKTTTNVEAQTRVDELVAYIDDLDSGRVELTTERVDLEKEIFTLGQTMSDMLIGREKEHEDYLAAVREITISIDSIQMLADTMEAATGGYLEGAEGQTDFLQGKARASQGEGFAARVNEASLLQKATELGSKFLDKGDALFLQRVLSGEVPKAHHWKKLNRKATLKINYKARSVHIQDVAAQMKATFEANLADAHAKEQRDVDDYNELNDAKDAERRIAQDALQNGDGEGGAKASAKQDSETERDALRAQISNDEGFISVTTTDLANKKAEWKDRSVLRAGEIEAIGKAIAILHSDDARDLFGSSLKSQTFFLQLRSSSRSKTASASEILESAGKRSGDKRLAALANTLQTPNPSMATGSHFDEVISAIDAMVTTLKNEEQSDLEVKEMCEEDRADWTRDAVIEARTMDERSDTIDALKNDIVDIKKTIAENAVEIAEINEEIAKATTMRGDENTEWLAADRDDTAAAALVMQAKDVLADFYADNNLVLIQKKMAPIEAGEAPPPPPATFEAPYGGKTGEATGIVAILEMIHQDITNDKAKSKADEDKAETTFQSFKTNSLTQIQTLTDANTALLSTQGEKEDDVSTAKEQRVSQHDQLKSTIQSINGQESFCVYTTINYPVRLKNRQVEIDGLEKAKAILEGGEFPSMLQRK